MRQQLKDVARATLGLAAVIGVSACGGPQSSGSAPAANMDMDAAFKAAFPQGAKVQDDGTSLTYAAKQLIPVSGDVEALIAEGTGEDACHACTGKLKIVYFNRAGSDLTAVGKPGGWSIDGDGSGAAPDWSIDTKSNPPVLTVKTSYEEQGCISSAVSVYQLGPQGVKEGKRASKHQEGEGCGSGDEGQNETDTRAAQIAGANANWDSYFRDHPDQAPKPDNANTSSDDNAGNTASNSSTPQ